MFCKYTVPDGVLLALENTAQDGVLESMPTINRDSEITRPKLA
jgi:hypothetical protein